MTTENQLLREALESYEHMIANGHREHDALHAFDAVDIPNLVRAALTKPAEGGEVVAKAQVPMTDEQRKQVFRDAENRMMREINLSWRDAVVECVEAHHGITAPAGGEG